MQGTTARFDYDFIIEKMRRKHSKYRDLKKPMLRSLKRSGSVRDLKLLNLLRQHDYRKVQEQLPPRLRAELVKMETITVRALQQLPVSRESEQGDHTMVRRAVQFNEEWLSSTVGLTPELIAEYMAGFQAPASDRKEEQMKSVEDEVFSLLLPERFEELHDIGLGTPKRQRDQFESKHFEEMTDYFIKP